MNSAFQELLVYILRYKFREAADRQGGGGGDAPPLKCGPGIVSLDKLTNIKGQRRSHNALYTEEPLYNGHFVT